VTRQERIQAKLSAALEPLHLEVENESRNHNVPPNSETHFKVLIVSQAFEALGTIDRHRRIHAALADELKKGLHALTLRALTPAQWEAEGSAGFKSPPCLGGSKAG
jgi:BolA-like protein 1